MKEFSYSISHPDTNRSSTLFRVVVSIVLALLLALTPGLAFASQESSSNTGNHGVAASDANVVSDDAANSAASGDPIADGDSAVNEIPAQNVVPGQTIEKTEEEPDTRSLAASVANGQEITIPAKVTSYGATSLSATVSYNSAIAPDQPIKFTYNVSGNTRSLLYRLYSLDRKTGDEWTSIVDVTHVPEGSYLTNNSFEQAFPCAGTYRLVFQVVEDRDFGNATRFQIEFTIAESSDFKSVESMIDEVAAECEKACADEGDSSDYAKALWLNDWIINHTTYDNSLIYMDAEGVFGRGLGTCEGYHDAYTKLLNKVGIETRRVDDFGDAHVWTGVKLDGKWYNVDTTWNDAPALNGNFPDVRHLYFAVPSNIMQLTHSKWDGTYSISRSDRAVFDASSYEDNYFIRSGEIAKYVQAYLASSGTYSVKEHLAAAETDFSLPVEKASWPADYKNVIYPLVAYQLGQEDWGSAKLSVSHDGEKLVCHAQRLLSSAEVEIPRDFDSTFTGSEIKPNPIVKVDGKTLSPDDYEVTYQNNVNAGTATVTVAGKGNYAGSKSTSFAIDRKAIPAPSFSTHAYTYDGQSKMPTVTVKDGTKILKEGTDYTVSYSDNVNVGTAKATVTGVGNYAGATSCTFEITPADLAIKVKGKTGSLVYNGGEHSISGYDIESILPEGMAIKLVGNADPVAKGTAVGNYGMGLTNGSFVVEGVNAGNYNISFDVTDGKLVITSADISDATAFRVDGLHDVVYNGVEQKLVPSVVDARTGDVLDLGTDYDLSYSQDVTNVGNVTVTVAGKGNYVGEQKVAYKILKRPVSLTGESGTRTYTGSEIKLTGITANTGEGIGLIKGHTWQATAEAKGTDAGAYQGTITPKAQVKIMAGNADVTGNYEVTATPGSLKIESKRIASADVQVAAPGNVVCNGEEQKPKPIVKDGDKTLIEGIDYTLSYKNNVNAGTATVTVTGKGNYTGSKSVDFQIMKSLAYAIVSVSGMTRNATGEELQPMISVRYGSSDLQAGADYDITYNDSTDIPVKAGEYTVKIVGKGDYSGEQEMGIFNLLQGPSVESGMQARIVSASNSDYVLDAAGATPKIGANVSIWTDNAGNNQKWNLVLGDDGYYTIRSVSNNEFILDAAGANPKQGSNVSIWTSNSGNNQKWLLEPSGDTYIIRSAADPNLVLDASGAKPKKGANVSAWTFNGGENQKWKVFADTGSDFDADKVYEISSVSNSNYVLDAAGATPRSGANVSIWAKNNGDNQKWHLVSDNKGYYYIKSASNDKLLLDAAGKNPHKGSNVSVWTFNEGDNQKWKIEKLPSGAYIIKSAANPSLVLDAAGATPSQGANVSIWSSNGGENQKWNIRAL